MRFPENLEASYATLLSKPHKAIYDNLLASSFLSSTFGRTNFLPSELFFFYLELKSFDSIIYLEANISASTFPGEP
jgi:hypothetical protein